MYRLKWLGLIPDPLDTDQYKSYTMSMDQGSGVITGVRHMQPRWEEQLIPDPMAIASMIQD